MPVTARLSKHFYERLGEQAANELVDWFNAVDATYKAELREFNELNFARFDAKVEQRFAQSDAKFEQRIAQSEVKFEQRFAQLEVKFEQGFGAVDRRFAETDAKMDKGFADVRTQMADLRADLLKWMFLFWTGTTLAGLLFR